MREKFGKIYGMWFEKTPVIVMGDEKIAKVMIKVNFDKF